MFRACRGEDKGCMYDMVQEAFRDEKNVKYLFVQWIIFFYFFFYFSNILVFLSCCKSVIINSITNENEIMAIHVRFRSASWFLKR